MPGLELFGWLVSPYTAKVRAMMAYKRLPFTDTEPSLLGLLFTVKLAVGRVIMPTIRRADGSWQQDSALICDELESRFPSPSTSPPGDAQRLASALLELYGDEWLTVLALHFRWDVPGNAAWAPREFGRAGLPWLPRWLSARLVVPFVEKMKSFRAVHGIGEETRPGLRRLATELIVVLDQHLELHPYLLGRAPCRGDFALYGPLWAHLYRDPHSRHLFDHAPHVRRWFERLHGHARDGGFPELPVRSQRLEPIGEFLPDDEVPTTLDAVFANLFSEQWPYIAGIAAQIDELAGQSCGGAAMSAKVPRALGSALFRVGGSSGSRRQITYQVWRLQRVLDTYQSFRTAGKAAADKWLMRLHALDIFHAVQLQYRLERDNSLPLAQETLHAVRSRL
eukprot:TRINITY_DN54968_c0_g1_i1.p1 TRINITY_DN54968_c0_g1~~TRINITY_DN54968_c0_g1_i1.p1  ORF type:complete len:394 (+),score=31.35 TRINITY_DN54968_c0_g1_i1:129-1310(+)